MGEGFHFLDIILIAMVAGFIILRLRSVLGRRTGHEPPPRPAAPLPAKRDDDNVVALPERIRREEVVEAAPAAAGSPLAAGIGRIKAVDRSFDTADFAAGAKGAYEMIVTAFASGDAPVLRPLLAPDVFASFNQAINDRKSKGEHQETTLVSIKQAEILEADLKGRMAEVTIKFVAELINVTRDSAGKVVAGDPNAVEDVTDIWTFSRDTRSGDPNWVLIGTSAPN